MSSSSLSTFSIRNPIPAIIFFFTLTIAGFVSLNKLPVNSWPNIVIPFVLIDVSYNGASASEIETQITRNIEASLSGINGLKHIDSQITTGISSTQIEFNISTDLDRALNDVKDAIAKIRSQLPESISEPRITRIDSGDIPFSTYLIEAPEMRNEDLSWFIDDYLSRELQKVAGVSKLQRSGGEDYQIILNLDPLKLIALGISAADISSSLSEANKDFPGGNLTLANKEYAIRILGSIKSIETLKEMRIKLLSIILISNLNRFFLLVIILRKR